MRIISKIFIMMFCLCLTGASYAKSPKEAMDEVIQTNPLTKSSVVSISVRNLNDKNVVYEKDSNLLLHPASTLKIFTSAADLYALGKDSAMITGVYKFNNNIYLKLSGDPLLTQNDLKTLFKDLKQKGYNSLASLIIDDTAVDKINWGEGWMQDDSVNSYMAQYSAYNLDKNIVGINITPTMSGQRAIAKPEKPNANLVLQNSVVTGDKNDITLERNFWKNPEKITVKGTINTATTVFVPIYDIQNYFLKSLKNAAASAGVELPETITYSGTPFNAESISFVSHSVLDILTDINQNSHNMAAESLFKAAGSAYKKEKGTTKNGIQLFNDFYQNINSDAQKIYIVDASGVSHNDLLTTDWMSNALYNVSKTQEFEVLKSTMAAPTINGTLKNRLPLLTNNLYAKTGTNAGISGITGYLTTQSGNKYSFAVLIQNYKGSSNAAKDLEDEILTTIYQYY